MAGPNGSGKSALYQVLHPPGVFINADVVARKLNPNAPERASYEAGRRVLVELTRLIATRQSFTYETTLSSAHSIALMRRAHDAGFVVTLAYVALQDAGLHVARVAQRVVEGGHDIPIDVILRRYHTSISRLAGAISLAHDVFVFDNSPSAGPTLLIDIRDGRIITAELDKANPLHLRYAHAVADALGRTVSAIFQAR